MTWCESPAALCLVLLCGHSRYTRWGTYPRKPRPHRIEIPIQRFFCLTCSRTSSVLPAFLLGHVHYTATTLAPYVDYIATHQEASLAGAWAHDPADGFPLDLATIYRWFKRLSFRLALVLSMLEKELLELTPEADLAALEKLIAKPAAIRFNKPQSPQHSATAPALTPHALCQSSLALARQLLRTTAKLLGASQHPKLPPLLFLNFFCCQKTNQALLSPAPPSTSSGTPAIPPKPP